MKLENHSSSLEDLFFDLELKLEKNAQCRDQICMDCKQEKCKYKNTTLFLGSAGLIPKGFSTTNPRDLYY